MNAPTPPSQLSFLPDDYLERKARMRANVLCGTLSLIVMGAIGTAFWLNERSMQGVDARSADVDKRFAEEAAKIDQVQRMHAKQRQIVQHAELAALLVEKVPRSNVLAEFTNALPPGTSLLELTLESRPRTAPTGPAGTAFDQKKAALDGKKPGGANPNEVVKDVFIKLVGIADNDVQVSQYIGRLNQSKLLKDVNLVISDVFQQDKVTLRRFQIEMMLNPKAEIRESPVDTQTQATEVAGTHEAAKN